MYTTFAAPNIVLPMCSGFAVQRYGERVVLLTAASCVVAGQTVFALAIHARSVWAIIFGRLLFGLGGEVMGVLANDIATAWFAWDSESHLTLALAIVLAIARFGGVVDFLVTPRLVESFGVVTAVWLVTAMAMGVTALGCLSLLLGLPNRATKHMVKLSTVATIRRLPSIYWQLLLICVLGYGGINTFTNSVQRFLAVRYFNGSQSQAGSAASITYVLSSVLVAPFGLLLELPRFKISQALVASYVLMLSAHLAFLLHISGSLLPLASLGTAYALYGVAFWAGLAKSFVGETEPMAKSPESCSALVCNDEDEDELLATSLPSEERSLMDPNDSTATAPSPSDSQTSTKSDEKYNSIAPVGFGVATSTINLTTTLVPIFLAGLENLAGFTGLEFAFVAFAGFGCLASIWLAFMRGSE
ncbi:hypothetical protein LTR22_012312 [Elasticomyces elasticus]|nr:hypothetical protein LTR22_012312 [Elasticomyces elasticus]